MGAELFHAYRQTDMTKLTADFRNFAHAPKNLALTVHGLAFAGLNKTKRFRLIVLQKLTCIYSRHVLCYRHICGALLLYDGLTSIKF